MSIYIHKSHNINVLIYHFVFPTKYRKHVIDMHVDGMIKEICLQIGARYEIHFIEIGSDSDHIHFLVQCVPTWSVTKIVTTIKSIIAREVFIQIPELKKILWGAHLWTSGYYVSTVGRNGSENVISKYVKGQGTEKEYIQLHKDQLKLFI